MKKIGILGGTFNPIHNGHIELALRAINEQGLDYVLIMPSGVSYMKAGTGVLDSKIRKEMTFLAVSNTDGLVFDDRETKREGNSYTCDTILELKDENPDSTLYYIIGADTLNSINTWKNCNIIFDNAVILVAVRDQETMDSMKETADKLLSEYNAQIEFLHFDKIDISSTEIRARIRTKQSIHGMVPDSVEQYIIENRLYSDDC